MSESSRQEKCTPWFPVEVRPARPGVYEIRGARFDGTNFRRWNGSGWSGTWSKPSSSCQQDIRTLYAHGEDMTGWRGLTRSALSASRGEQPTVKASDGAGMKE